MTHQPNNVSAAGVLTEEIKALARQKPTASNAYGLKSWEEIERKISDALAAASAQATAPVGWFVQRSSFGPWIEVERYEDGAVRLRGASSAAEPKP